MGKDPTVEELKNMTGEQAIDWAFGKAMEDINPKTGKLTAEHMENCTGCALCEGGDGKR